MPETVREAESVDAIVGERRRGLEASGRDSTRDAPSSERLKRVLELATVIVVSGGFAASFGLNYGFSNQVTYLVPSLQLLDADLYKQDWFVQQTTHVHPAFEYLGALLLAMNAEGWAIALGSVVVIGAATIALYSLLRAISGPRLALPAFLLLLACLFVTRTSGPAVSYAFDSILQPSTIGSAAFIGSVCFFVRERFLASSIFMALCGLFHANHLLLFFGAYAVAHCLLGISELRRRLVLQLALPALVALWHVPMVLGHTGGVSAEDAVRARQLIIELRAPHHFVLGNLKHDFMPFVAWTLIGSGLCRSFARGALGQPAIRLLALTGGILAIVGVGVIAHSALGLQQATMLFPWRIIPHGEILLQALAVSAALRLTIESPRVGSFRWSALSMLGAGIGLLGFASALRGDTQILRLVLTSAAIGAAVTAGRALAPKVRLGVSQQRLVELGKRHAALLATAASALLLHGAALNPLRAIRQRSNIFDGLPREQAELYAWMQTTPKDALFLTPPDIEGMRLHGKRAIVVDWKSGPQFPAEILEWWRRLQDVSGRQDLRRESDLRGYDALDQTRLDFLRDRYKVDYAVLRRGRERALSPYRRCYQNPAFVVIEVAHRG